MQLDQMGELRRISATVDPVLEVSEIADRVSKAPTRDGEYPAGQAPFAGTAPKYGTAAVNQALLFEHVKGSAYPLVINTFGSYRRIHAALGCESLDALAQRIADLTQPQLPADG